jgi:hypothetical protein
MPASKISRLLALFAVALLVFGACRNNNPDDDDDQVETTEAPDPTPSIEAVADFQLVGRIDEAFAGQLPPVDLPDDDLELDTDATASPGTSPGATPAGTPVGTTPTRGGIIRLEIEDLSDDLEQACGFGADSIVELYWTTNTFFEPGDVLDDVEDEIEDRVAAITGRIFRSGDDADVLTPEPTTEATGSPAATGSPSASVEASDCLLVAEQVGFTSTALPTARPVAARTAAPTPARTATATATPARTATPSPRATSTPPTTVNPSPAASATP